MPSMSRQIQSEQEWISILHSGKKVLVLFYASWCPFCKRFLPVYERNCGDKENSCLIVTDELETLEDDYAVEVVPTVICFQGGKEIKRLDGIPGKGLSEKQLRDFLHDE